MVRAGDRSQVRFIAGLGAGVAPALFLLWFILNYGVDTPLGDQWDGMAHLYEKMQARTLGLDDFFDFHNEHRIFFPRLLSFGLARLTHWNIRAEMVTIWTLLCLCAFNIRGLAQETKQHEGLLIPANVLLFTVLQYENLLWGFQIGFLFPLATLTASLWAATSLRRPFDFLATIALCLLTTFSIASGFTSWLLTAPILICKNRLKNERVWWSVWIATSVWSICYYFQGYARPAGHPSQIHALTHPLLALQFFFIYLGRPFATNLLLALIAGVILCLSLIFCAVCLWRAEKTTIRKALPWLSLAGIGLTSAGLTTIGRAGFGLAAAVPSRYVTFAMTVPIALIFLVSLLVRQSKWRLGFSALGLALALPFVLGSIHCFKLLPAFQHRLLLNKAVIQFSNVLDEPEALRRYVHGMGPALRPRLNALDRLGYLHPPLLRSREIAPLARRPQDKQMGQLANFARKDNGDFAARGWAILPERHRIADSVLLAYEIPDGGWRIFARTETGLVIPELNNLLGNVPFENSGWLLSWRADQLPAETHRISAWAYDAESAAAYPIGVVSL